SRRPRRGSGAPRPRARLGRQPGQAPTPAPCSARWASGRRGSPSCARAASCRGSPPERPRPPPPPPTAPARLAPRSGRAAAAAERARCRRGAWRQRWAAESVWLAIRAFGALIAEPMFLLADSAIVGRLGTAPLGSLGVAAQALTALVNVSIFLAYGTTAAVSR